MRGSRESPLPGPLELIARRNPELRTILTDRQVLARLFMASARDSVSSACSSTYNAIKSSGKSLGRGVIYGIKRVHFASMDRARGRREFLARNEQEYKEKANAFAKKITLGRTSGPLYDEFFHLNFRPLAERVAADLASIGTLGAYAVAATQLSEWALAVPVITQGADYLRVFAATFVSQIFEAADFEPYRPL